MAYQFRGGAAPRKRRARVGVGTPNARVAPAERLRPAADTLRPGRPTDAARPGRAPTPAPGKPKPAAKSPKGQHPEFDEEYFRDINRAEEREGESLSGIAGQRENVKHDFGIDDPTNPFSRATGLKRAYLARRKAASAGLASQGQLYSGAHSRALQRTRLQEEAAYDELRRSYMDALGALNEKERETKYATEDEREAAFQEWLARAPEADAPLGEEAPALAPTAPPKPQNLGTEDKRPPRENARPVGQVRLSAGLPDSTKQKIKNLRKPGKQALTERRGRRKGKESVKQAPNKPKPKSKRRR